MTGNIPLHELPKELGLLWKRAAEGKAAEVKSVLEEVPMWRDLRRSPPENNHLADGKKKNDRFLRSMQQTTLHQLRVMCYIYALGALNAGQHRYMQQLIGYLADSYYKVERERKEVSLPGNGDKLYFSM